MVGENRRVSVLGLGEVKVGSVGCLCVDEKRIGVGLGFVKENGIELEVDGVNVVGVGWCERKDVIVEGSGWVGRDVEMFGMVVYVSEELVGG